MVKETQAGATAEDTKKEGNYRTFAQTNKSKKTFYLFDDITRTISEEKDSPKEDAMEIEKEADKSSAASILYGL